MLKFDQTFGAQHLAQIKDEINLYTKRIEALEQLLKIDPNKIDTVDLYLMEQDIHIPAQAEYENIIKIPENKTSLFVTIQHDDNENLKTETVRCKVTPGRSYFIRTGSKKQNHGDRPWLDIGRERNSGCDTIWGADEDKSNNYFKKYPSWKISLVGDQSLSIKYTPHPISEEFDSTKTTIKLTNDKYKMSSLISGYKTIKEIPYNLDCSELTRMDGMFEDCRYLEEVPMINTKNFTNFARAYFGCMRSGSFWRWPVNIDGFFELDFMNIDESNGVNSIKNMFCQNGGSRTTYPTYIHIKHVPGKIAPLLKAKNLDEGSTNGPWPEILSYQIKRSVGTEPELELDYDIYYKQKDVIEVPDNIDAIDFDGIIFKVSPGKKYQVEINSGYINFGGHEIARGVMSSSKKTVYKKLKYGPDVKLEKDCVVAKAIDEMIPYMCEKKSFGNLTIRDIKIPNGINVVKLSCKNGFDKTVKNSELYFSVKSGKTYRLNIKGSNKGNNYPWVGTMRFAGNDIELNTSESYMVIEYDEKYNNSETQYDGIPVQEEEI